jgi:hypothetical protein
VVKPATAPAPVPAAKVTPPPAPAPVAKPAPKPAAPAPAKAAGTTSITARIDIGFGNVLFIRGEGPGLSWDKGVQLDCVAADIWRITLPDAGRKVTFKFLVNDLSWSVGEDYSVAGGSSVTLTPGF